MKWVYFKVPGVGGCKDRGRYSFEIQVRTIPTIEKVKRF